MTDGDVADFERDKEAVCLASNYPISICALGIGDGPFEKMEMFDNLENDRKFDNFHFCNFTQFMQKASRMENPELELAT